MSTGHKANVLLTASAIHCSLPGLVVWAFKRLPHGATVVPLIRSMKFAVRVFFRVPLFPLKLETL